VVGVSPPGNRTWRILLAEDNVVNQIVATRMLTQLGCTADLAATGTQVLSLLEQGCYDLILMDCMMPELDGYQVTTEIRRREQDGGRIPIVAMTAGVMDGDRERCMDAGMDDYVSKPISRQSLTAALSRWLPRTSGG
jgi:CheY-like chemotaxis protein